MAESPTHKLFFETFHSSLAFWFPAHRILEVENLEDQRLLRTTGDSEEMTLRPQKQSSVR
jgi:hypothetical protein